VRGRGFRRSSTCSVPTAACSAAICRSCGLSRSFELLYDAYGELVGDLSPGEQDRLFRGTATAWFGLDRLGLAVGGGAARNGTQ
jgi:hypothetical protein